jgi:crossover junction endodeoxyribonuclease RuvC
MLEMNVVKLNGKKDMFDRLGVIHEVIQELIKKYKPSDMAIEAPFFGKNVQSMLKLGRAQGIAIAVGIANKLEVTEYSPKKVKQSITGNGNANKEQVWKMLNNIMPLTHSLKYYDASDALAVAVCHHFNGHGIKSASAPATKKTKTKKASAWEDFIKKNPHRVS